jgi:hypothetical protein
MPPMSVVVGFNRSRVSFAQVATNCSETECSNRSDLRIPFSVQYCATFLVPTKKCRLLFGEEFDILSNCLASVASLRWRVVVVPMTFRMRQTPAMTDSRSSALAVASGDEHRGHPGGMRDLPDADAVVAGSGERDHR